ncbi:1356_t:CDS:2 [Ambispora leptoticha]|uniref:1356_t:CDS:1 n=1 Tax=Ambispora leptoticha TaxID=144679 RepID=A0A9N9FJX8_9GLOM|nr:1356_t:CDS:2 [Ambispora leptoticha]
MITDESNDSHENKRVKITTACDTCRRRKVKCDGATPCTNCGRGGYQCNFSDASTKRPRGPPKGFVALIEDRLHTIESLLVNLTKDKTPNTPPADVNSQPINFTIPGDQSSDDEDDLEKNSSSSITNNYQDNTLYLQPASQSEPELPSSLPQINPPPQDVVNQLLDKFFTHFHPFFPIINRTQLYRQLQSTDDQPSPLLMYAIYAVGALYPPILQDSYSPMTFYEHAKSLLDHFLDAPRLSTVQALILLCMVDQGKTSSYRSQSYSFMAIRMAQSMRLNRKNSAIYQQSRNKHTKKLVWWSCFILDRLHSLSTGDPLTINEETCDIELPLADEVDDQSGELQQTPHNTSHAQTVMMFVHFIRLTQLMGQIINYLQTIACTDISTSLAHHNMISYYEAALLSWIRDLPPYLQFPPAGHGIPPAGQIAALHMHYHTLKIMLHYPYIASRSTSPQVSKTYLKSLNACVNAANMISHISAVSLNNVYVCITYPTMFHCLAQAANVHIININSANKGLASHAYANIYKTINVGQFYAEHGVMSELANRTIKTLEGVLIAHRDPYIETVIPSTATTVSSNIPHIRVSSTSSSTMFAPLPLASDHSLSTLTTPVISFGPYSSPASTHLSSPTIGSSSQSPSIQHTPTITYIQQSPSHIQKATQAFLPDTVPPFGSDEYFDPTVSSTNMIAAVSDLGQEHNSCWNMNMNFSGSQSNLVHNSYELASSASSSSCYSSP